MSQVAFDSHRFVKGAVETGLNEKQAEFLATSYQELLTDRIATKEDIFRLEQRIDSLEQRMNSLEKTMWRIAVMQMGFVSILFALIKFL